MFKRLNRPDSWPSACFPLEDWAYLTQTALVFLQPLPPWRGSDKADDNLRTVALSLSLVVRRRPRLHLLALEHVLLFPKEEKE